MPSTGQLRTLLQGRDPHEVKSVWCNRAQQQGWAVRIELRDDAALNLACDSELEARELVEDLIDRAHDVGRR